VAAGRRHHRNRDTGAEAGEGGHGQTEVDRILGEVERRLTKGEQIDLKQLGFWRAVEGVKRHREWIEAYADRVSAIERVVFRRSTWRHSRVGG
jgi:hypothetical protein